VKHLFAFLLLSIVILISVWDIVAVYRGRPQDEVSHILQSWAHMFPILPLVVGILIGHVFWPTKAITGQ
jgi:hypothetical protein